MIGLLATPLLSLTGIVFAVAELPGRHKGLAGCGLVLSLDSIIIWALLKFPVSWIGP